MPESKEFIAKGNNPNESYQKLIKLTKKHKFHLECLIPCRNFGQFDYSQTAQGHYDPLYQPTAYTGNIMTPEAPPVYSVDPEDFENEPPLMEGESPTLILGRFTVVSFLSLLYYGLRP